MVGLRDFFNCHCYVPCKEMDDILEKLRNLGVRNKTELRGYASVWNLKKLGFRDEDVYNIMNIFFAVVRREETDSGDSEDQQHGESLFQRRAPIDHGEDTNIGRLTR
jgi:hypothetical protein